VLASSTCDSLPWTCDRGTTALRIDVFSKREGGYDQVELDRRQPVEIAPGRHRWVKSAEDSVLRKLLWFRGGGEVSQRQRPC